MAAHHKRVKSLEAKMFEEFPDEELLASARRVMRGEIKNIPQLNFILEVIKRKMEKEKVEGHVNIDYMSLVDVGRAALEDDDFMNTLIKAFMAKKRIASGSEHVDSPKNYKQFTEAVKKAAGDRGMSAREVKSQTQHFLGGKFDEELEEVKGHADKTDVSK